MPPILILSLRAYAGFLRIYPLAYQERFAGEMRQVFRQLVHEAYRRSGIVGLITLWLAAIWDGTWAALEQWRQQLVKGGKMNLNTNPLDRRDGIPPLSKNETILAVLPFLLFGIASILSKIDLYAPVSAPPSFWLTLLLSPYLVFNWLILIGLGVGISLGFPRWAFSYLGWALLFVWWWSNMGFYGYHWTWQIWVPFLGTVLLGLIASRSWQPLRALLNGLRQDGTLFSLGIFILFTYAAMLADENHHPLILLFITGISLCAALGAWGYFRQATPLKRVLALMGGFVGASALSLISESTWDFRAYYGLPESTPNGNFYGIIIALVSVVVMIGNGLLERWRIRRKAGL